MASPLTSTTCVGAAVLISSRPSSLDTTNARSVPKRANAFAMTSRYDASDTPMTWRRAPAGLVSGPRKLKIVRTPSSFRTGTTWRMAWWWRGANMKPKPTLSMHSPTAPGSSSMLAPSASSTSAEPHWLVAERLPCLAILQPAPAAMKAAVVDTLKVGLPPPVPAVSTRSPSASTLTASSLIVRARPAISATVSPLVRSAIRKAAVSASDALPDITSRSTREASSADRSLPPASRSIASVTTALGIEEVAQQRLAVAGEHRLGVELDALRGQLAVAQAHHGLTGAGRYLELGRQVRGDDERVVAAGHHG